MAADQNGERNFAVSVPVSLIAAAIAIVSGATAAYILANRSDEEMSSNFGRQMGRRPGKNFGRKVGLRALIALLENDASRRVVIAVLKAMSRRG